MWQFATGVCKMMDRLNHFAPCCVGRWGAMAHFMVIVALVSLLGVAQPSEAAARRADPGPAPAGCWWGPRGGVRRPLIQSRTVPGVTSSHR